MLIVNGDNLHVIVDVVMKAIHVGFDIVILVFYTSHRLQPLDVGIFAPFKRVFKNYRNALVLIHPRQVASKKILAM